MINVVEDEISSHPTIIMIDVCSKYKHGPSTFKKQDEVVDYYLIVVLFRFRN